LAYKPPYLLLYVNDLLGSHYVDLMDMEQFGWYMRLLVRSWQWDTPCYLPNDMAVLRSILRVGRRQKEIEAFNERFPIVFERFSVTDDGQSIFHPKLVEQYNDLQAKFEKQSEGGRSTASKHTGKHAGKQQLTSKVSRGYSEPEPESDSKENLKPARAASDVRFDRVKKFVKKCCEFKHVPFIWDVSEGKQLKSFLDSAGRDMSVEAVCSLVRNRFNSREPPGDRPRIWLSNLGRYATVSNGKQQTYADKNQQSVIDAVNASIAGDTGLDQEGNRNDGHHVRPADDRRTIDAVRRDAPRIQGVSTANGIQPPKT
jgi:uncharacterized protein YdaU (DUF1376 family)